MSALGHHRTPAEPNFRSAFPPLADISSRNVRFPPVSGRESWVCVRSAPSHKRTLALPQEVEHWSLTTLREKLIKIRAKVVRHGRYITFQLAEVAIPRSLFANILRLIDGLRPAPLPP